jgi:uncharacterized repeat protein (TIGR01451 family)
VNLNGVRDSTEQGIPDVVLKISNRDWYVVTDSTGQYKIFAELIQDTIAPVPPIAYCDIVPPFVVSNPNQPVTDFAVQTDPDITDVSVTAANTQVFRPGYITEVWVQLRNQGTVPLDSVRLVLADFDDYSPLQWLDATPAPDSIAGDSLIWNALNVDLFGKTDIRLRFITTEDAFSDNYVQLPFTAIRDGDVQPADNLFELVEKVVFAFDPNDKQVSPDTLAPVQLATEDLYYTIRFQNTGNYPADFVRILDTLPEELNLATLRILGASHPFTWRIRDGRILDFSFNPIFLPDSISNEPASHGYIQFAIRAQSDLPSGTVILNRAAIYFDYNPPIITNFAGMHVLDPVVSAPEFIQEESAIALMPNPATQQVWVTSDGLNLNKVTILNSLGQAVKTVPLTKLSGQSGYFMVGDVPNGKYIVVLEAESLQRYAKKLTVVHQN